LSLDGPLLPGKIAPLPKPIVNPREAVVRTNAPEVLPSPPAFTPKCGLVRNNMVLNTFFLY
jgi:hypothetical protein